MAIGDRVAKLERAQFETRRTALRREVRGARLFMFGAVLSTVASCLGALNG